MTQYIIQFSFNKKAGEYIGKVAIREQAMKIASAYAKKALKTVDIFEYNMDTNSIVNRWIAFTNGGIWKN